MVLDNYDEYNELGGNSYVANDMRSVICMDTNVNYLVSVCRKKSLRNTWDFLLPSEPKELENSI